jgi:hypothetical protein
VTALSESRRAHGLADGVFPALHNGLTVRV